MPRSFILAWRASANKRSEGRGRPPSSSSFLGGWLVLEVERVREALLYYAYFPSSSFSPFLTNGDASFDAAEASLLFLLATHLRRRGGFPRDRQIFTLSLSLVWQANLTSASSTKRNYSVNLKGLFPWAKRCCFILFFFFQVTILLFSSSSSFWGGKHVSLALFFSDWKRVASVLPKEV